MREALVLEIKKNRNLLARDCDFHLPKLLQLEGIIKL